MRPGRNNPSAKSDLGSRLPDWQDEWKPQPWKPPAEADEYDSAGNRRPRISRAAVLAAQRPRVDRKREQLLLAISPGIAGFTALILWFLSPLPGAGSIPLPFIVLATIQVVGYVISRDDRPETLSKPWTIHLAAAIGLTPILAIQVALIREPYVSIDGGSSLPAALATALVILFTLVLAIISAVRFWKRPDQAGLVFLPIALLIPQALGERTDIRVGQAIGIIAFAMLLGAAATVGSAYVGIGVRLLIPPSVLALEIIVLWIAGRGPVLQETSGGVVKLLYFLSVAAAVVFVVAVPIFAVWLRRWVPPSMGGIPARSR